MRYVDDRVATVWLQTDAPCEVEILGARERTWCVDGLHFALVAVEGLTPGADHPYEVRLDGAVVWPQDCGVSAQHDPPARPGEADRRRVRLVPDHAPARAAVRAAGDRARRRPGHRRAARLRAADGARRRRGRRAGHAADARRPDLRRPALARAPGGLRRPRAPGRRARGRARRLQRVRARLPRGVVGPSDPLAAVDHARDDGLRRPRDPRRVADLAGLARRDERGAVVRRPHPRRAHGLLGLPAHRQPLPRPADRRRSVRRGPAPRRRGRPARHAHGHRGPSGRPQPLELRPRPRRRPPRRDRLARRAPGRARAPRARPGRGVAVDPRAGLASRPAICCWRARCPSCSPPACTTSRPSTRR